MDTSRPIRMQVHGSEDRRIDGILSLIEESSKNAPLPEILQRMCEQVAAIAHAEVVSVYVREQEQGRSVFVLRANVGLAREMLGSVKLELGEGITGFAAECLRPVSAAIAEQDSHYKFVPELGEEAFPTFLSIPLVIGGKAVGVLNLQRKQDGDFTSAEVALSAALATPFTLALDRHLRPGNQENGPLQEPGRSARLTGTGSGHGHTIGKAHSALTFHALAEPDGSPTDARAAVEAALTRVNDQLDRTSARLDLELSPDHRRGLASLSVTLQDQRLISLLDSSVKEHGLIAGLRKVARDYVAAPYMIGGDGSVDPWLSARASEIEELCLWIAGEAAGDTGPGPGSVAVVAERLCAFAVIGAVARGVAGIVVGGSVEETGLPTALARAGRLPIVSEVAGLFAWVRSGDTLLLDADRGMVRVNPSASVIASYRHRKSQG